MKDQINSIATQCLAGFLALILFAGCKKNDSTIPVTSAQSFNTVNLVGSDASFAAGRTDPHLLNAWGIAFSPTGNPWISSTGDHSSAVYNSAGAQALAPVSIPTHLAPTGGLPTGQVYNASSGFKLLNGNPARFIFAGLDGVISGWNGGGAAVTMVDRNGISVYTGLTMAATGTNAADSFIYAADFKSGKIDVFDNQFALRSVTFTDPGLPTGYAPFNIQSINNLLFVMYAIPDPVEHEKKGPGLGIVSVFLPNGTFVNRFITGGALNAPWGIAKAPSGWLNGAPGDVLLIGNFGDGYINAYDAGSGVLLGPIKNNGTPIEIDGLWGISFPPATSTVDQNRLYFAAGPADETKGLFGYITN